MISKEQKEQIVAQYGRTAGDTGSPEVQIAILTARINDLTDHFKAKRTSCIPEEDRHRKISCTDRETWIKKIIHAFYGDIRKNVPFSLSE